MQVEPIENRVVLVGGGHSHCIFLKRWAMRREKPPSEIILINPEAFTPYTGMLPGLISGYYKKEEVYIDLGKLCNSSGARFLRGQVESINLVKKTLTIQGRPELFFDLISIDVGITSKPSDFSSTSKSVVSAKPLDQLYSSWNNFILKSTQLKKRKINIIGGGLGGVELAFSAYERLEKEKIPYDITILDRGPILKNESRGLKSRLKKLMQKNSFKIIESTNIVRIEDAGIEISDGSLIESDFTILASGAYPYPWIKQSGIPCINGFIIVDKFLRSPKFPFLYAAGDCAHLQETPRPKAGVFAVRAGPYLFHNILAKIEKKALKKFNPQRNHLKLISIGRRRAISAGRGFHLSGSLIWKLKDLIDRNFMDSFFRLRPMSYKNPKKKKYSKDSSDQMLCGGCGSKIGHEMLKNQIGKINNVKDKNVLNEIGDDAAIIKNGKLRQIITTDHLRAFTKDPWLMSRITIIHSLGDIWAMGAKPNFALLNIVIPEASKPIQASWLEEIMDAAKYTFLEEKISLIGGHTTQGAELTIGVTLIGEVGGLPLEISKAKIGDKIILTKPIGTGVLLAGEMQGLTAGDHFMDALAWMQKSQAPVTILSADVNAMTDVTGFGLIGHLMNICEASSVSAQVSIKKVPLLNGAIELSSQGVRSTLFADNTKQKKRVNKIESPVFDLLFDPQTSGGMLISVPKERVKTLQVELRKAGLLDSVIGEIKKGEPSILLEN